jgi:flagellar export protein FliJ
VNEIEKLKNEKQNEKNKLMSKTSLRASEAQFLNNFEKLMNEKIQIREKQILLMNQKLKVKIEELKQKSMEHKIFETLEGKHLDQYRIELNKYEQKEFDEIATVKVQKSRS